MYAVILAGGSGTRLWPLSRERYPKQFLPAPGHPEREGEREGSLFEATVLRVANLIPPERILVVTHTDQAPAIRRHLEQAGLRGVRLLEEPLARNTAPAIGLAAWFIQREAGPEAIMAVLPSDHLIPDHESFAAYLSAGAEAAAACGLVTFGIRPTYPETGYGYICCGEQLTGQACRVVRFVEKPDPRTAEAYLQDGNYFWNSGMFVFRVGVLIEEYKRLLPAVHEAFSTVDFADPASLAVLYGNLENISIDYGIMERCGNAAVIPAALDWSDLGSWEAYHQAAPGDEKNNFFRGRVLPVDTENSLVLSASRLVGTVGLRDVVIIDTDDALLVCNRRETQKVKEVVDRLRAEGAAEARDHPTVHRPWGSYTSLELAETYQVKRIEVNPGARLSLQSHNHRAEHWVVVEGEALVTVDEKQLAVKKGESIFIPTGTRHRMENRGVEKLVIIEVQNGSYLGEDDIVRYEDDYGRAGSGDNAAGTRENTDPARAHYERWLKEPSLDPALRTELEAMAGDTAAIQAHFEGNLVFGTGGMRGLIGPGLNRINSHIIRRVTQGLADYLKALPDSPGSSIPSVAIAYDTRHYSSQFAVDAALVLAANRIRALLFPGVCPTPLLSYAVRELGCAAGIVITASHNPPGYNGYKIYGPDGGQAVSPLVDEVIAAIERVDIFDDVKTLEREEAASRGLLEEIGPGVESAYLDQVRALSLERPASRLRVVYTPLHGTGAVLIPGLLEECPFVELVTVSDQMVPDPHFSTVTSPNPEDPAALEAALETGCRSGAELILATDPDADRVGTAVRGPGGGYVILSGNQVGALLVEYLCSRLQAAGRLPAGAALVKTVVTGDLGRRVAEAYGLRTVETLTGFKFIGEQIEAFERSGGPQFIFGYEESCGYLTGTFVRDKDAVIASFLIAEMTAYYRDQNRSLLDVLEELQRRHGYHREELLTIELEDIAEADRYVAAFRDLPPRFAGQAVTEKRDYQSGEGLNLATGTTFRLELPVSPVLHYTLEDGSWFAVRPSGTEPKVKFYLAATGPTAAGAENRLKSLHRAVQAINPLPDSP